MLDWWNGSRMVVIKSLMVRSGSSQFRKFRPVCRRGLDAERPLRGLMDNSVSGAEEFIAPPAHPRAEVVILKQPDAEPLVQEPHLLEYRPRGSYAEEEGQDRSVKRLPVVVPAVAVGPARKVSQRGVGHQHPGLVGDRVGHRPDESA